MRAVTSLSQASKTPNTVQTIASRGTNAVIVNDGAVHLFFRLKANGER